MPELFAFAGLAFALDESFSIYGGNLKSTMAGEFSFSIALSIGILGLGVFSRVAHRPVPGLGRGADRRGARSHGIVAIFVLLARPSSAHLDRPHALRLRRTVGLTTMLLFFWWVGPFILDHEYMTDMKYGYRPQGATDSFWDMYFPLTAPLDILITALAIVGFVGASCGGISPARPSASSGSSWPWSSTSPGQPARDRAAVESPVAAVPLPRPLPAHDVRRLRAVRAVVERGARSSGVGTGRRLGVDCVRRSSLPSPCSSSSAGCSRSCPATACAPHGGQAVYAWGPLRRTSTNRDAEGDGWSRYNFLGYEGRRDVVHRVPRRRATMERSGTTRTSGAVVRCGRTTRTTASTARRWR